MTRHTILQLSDTHLVATPGVPVHGADPDANLDAVLAACEPHISDVDLVVLSGDLTDDQSPAAYLRLRERVDELGIASIALAGNHDDAVVLAEHFDTPTVTGLGDWRIVGIDTARLDQAHGTVDVAAAAAVLEDLDGPVLLVMHHPPTSPSTRPTFSLDHDDEFLAMIASTPRVRGIISGHLHQPFERILTGGAVLLGCPSTLIGVVHTGATYHNGEGAVIGARFIHLQADGTVGNQLITI